MDFALFVAANLFLLVRPEEMFPGLAGFQFYLLAMGLCVLVAAPRLVGTLQPAELADRPITCCVLLFGLAVSLSRLGAGDSATAVWLLGDFGKRLLHYLLLVSILDTPGRLRAFLGVVVVFVLVLTAAPLLQYHEVIDHPALKLLERPDQLDPATGEPIVQLISTGIYADPNDFCLILVTGMLCALYRAATSSGAGRVGWLLPLVPFVYAVLLTKSRGGLLGLAAAGGAWAVGYYGWRRTLPAAVLLGAVAVAAGGRQTNINLGEGDTAFQRFELWRDGLNLLKSSPVTGIGWSGYLDQVGLQGHNSFIHAYVETGVVGGTLFLGMFVLAGVGVWRSRPAPGSDLDRMRPFIQAIVVGYAVGILSISRSYVTPTFVIVGLGAAYLRMVPVAGGRPGVTAGNAARLYALGLAGLAVFYFGTQALMKVAGEGD